MIKHLFKIFLIFFTLSSLYSCATKDEMQMLESSLRAYEKAIRWGNFTLAKSFHKNNSALNDLERRRLKSYRVTGYNIVSAQTPNNSNAFRLVEIKYYNNYRPIIKTISVEQVWKRDKGSKVWYLDSSFPKFK